MKGRARDLSRCLFCGRELDARAACAHCGREAADVTVRARELDVRCPRCFLTLELVSEAPDVEFLYCVGCHGSFVPPWDFGQLAYHATGLPQESPMSRAEWKALPEEQGPARGAQKGSVACPVCNAEMERVVFPGGSDEIDVCSVHGIWFDAAELPGVLRAAREAEAPTERRVHHKDVVQRFTRLERGGGGRGDSDQ